MLRTTKLKPLKDEIIIFGEEDSDISPSGLHLVRESEKRRPQTGWIVKIGPKVKQDFHIGQKIVFNHWEAKETKLDSQTQFIVAEKEILAVLED